MCQKTDLIFQDLLKRAQSKKLNIEDVYVLIRKLITNLLLLYKKIKPGI